MKLADYPLEPLARRKVTVRRRTRNGGVEVIKLELELQTADVLDQVRVEAAQHVDAYDPGKTIVDRDTAIRTMETTCLLARALKKPSADGAAGDRDDTWAGPTTLQQKLDNRTINLLADLYFDHLARTIDVIADDQVANAEAFARTDVNPSDENADGVEIPEA